MATAKPAMLTAVFRDRFNADQAYERLISYGYTRQEINFLMSDETRTKYYAHGKEAGHPAGTQAAEGVAVGGAIGTTVGAIALAIAAIGTSIAIPGLGLVVAGPIAAALVGAGAGAVSGGIIGGLVGLGIPESNAKAYEAALREGGIVIGVTPRTREDGAKIKQDFSDLHGENILYT